MPIETGLMRRLGLAHPIIQAPLAGGGDTPALVAAVCEAGALGFIGAAYLTPQQIAEAAREVRQRTPRPFGVNLFAPLAQATLPPDPGPALRRVMPFFAELGLPPPAAPNPPEDSFAQQLAAALDSGAAVFSFTMGLLPAAALAAARERAMFLMGTATTVDEAVALERAGVDAVILQGSEAGGHRAKSLPEEAGIGLESRVGAFVGLLNPPGKDRVVSVVEAEPAAERVAETFHLSQGVVRHGFLDAPFPASVLFEITTRLGDLSGQAGQRPGDL